MRSKSDIEQELAKVRADVRLGYPPATVFANAPLALIQVELKARISVLQWFLEGINWDEDDGANPTSGCS